MDTNSPSTFMGKLIYVFIVCKVAASHYGLPLLDVVQIVRLVDKRINVTGV